MMDGEVKRVLFSSSAQAVTVAVMLPPVLFVSLVLLSCAQAGDVEPLRGELHTRDDYASSRDGVMRFRKTLGQTVDKLTEIETFIDSMMKDVRTLPESCGGDIVQELENIKSSAVSDFFHCPNLIPGLLNILSMFDITVEMGFDLIVTSVDAVEGAFGCISQFWPWKIVACWKNDISDDYDQIVKQTKLYRSLVEEYGENLTSALKWCWQHTAVTVDHDVRDVVAPAYNCAGRDIPIMLSSSAGDSFSSDYAPNQL